MFHAGKHYGEGIIKEYSIKLTRELGKGYTETNLRYMKQFYLFEEKYHAVRDNLSWTHYRTLLSLKDSNEINYYIDISIKYNLSYRQLKEKIKLNEYERLDGDTKNKLINNKETNISDFIKKPIILNNKNKYDINKEYALKRVILEDIPNFLEQLGHGFSFIRDEYKIKVGDNYNYIDLLLFNYIYNCFVVIELKVTKLKKEHIGQIKFYMNYIDENVRKINQEKTIGIIICKENDEYVIKYSSDSRIYETTYMVN